MVIFLHEAEAGEVAGQSVPLEGGDDDAEEDAQLRDGSNCRIGQQMAQFAVAGRAEAKAEEEGRQHQAEGIDAVAGNDCQHVHVDDFQREADDAADTHQQQGGKAETATL